MTGQLQLESDQGEQLVYISPKPRATYHPFYIQSSKAREGESKKMPDKEE